VRWSVLNPDGSKWEYAVAGRNGSGALMVSVAFISRDYDIDLFAVCATCGCLEEAGNHHRDGCPHSPAHRKWCVQCQERPPRVDAEPLFVSSESRALEANLS
jgi:hypothetical protein